MEKIRSLQWHRVVIIIIVLLLAWQAGGSGWRFISARSSHSFRLGDVVGYYVALKPEHLAPLAESVLGNSREAELVTGISVRIDELATVSGAADREQAIINLQRAMVELISQPELQPAVAEDAHFKFIATEITGYGKVSGLIQESNKAAAALSNARKTYVGRVLAFILRTPEPELLPVNGRPREIKLFL